MGSAISARARLPCEAACYPARVPDEALTLLTLTVLGALWLTSHVLLLLSAARSEKLRPWLRWLALLPPATPVLGFVAGQRLLGVLWLVLGVVYAALRISSS
jgi:hypothetical protein